MKKKILKAQNGTSVPIQYYPYQQSPMDFSHGPVVPTYIVKRPLKEVTVKGKYNKKKLQEDAQERSIRLQTNPELLEQARIGSNFIKSGQWQNTKAYRDWIQWFKDNNLNPYDDYQPEVTEYARQVASDKKSREDKFTSDVKNREDYKGLGYLMAGMAALPMLPIAAEAGLGEVLPVLWNPASTLGEAAGASGTTLQGLNLADKVWHGYNYMRSGKDLASENGLRKTADLYRNGDYWGGTKSALGDALNVAMLAGGMGELTNDVKSGYNLLRDVSEGSRFLNPEFPAVAVATEGIAEPIKVVGTVEQPGMTQNFLEDTRAWWKAGWKAAKESRKARKASAPQQESPVPSESAPQQMTMRYRYDTKGSDPSRYYSFWKRGGGGNKIEILDESGNVKNVIENPSQVLQDGRVVTQLEEYNPKYRFTQNSAGRYEAVTQDGSKIYYDPSGKVVYVKDNAGFKIENPDGTTQVVNPDVTSLAEDFASPEELQNILGQSAKEPVISITHNGVQTNYPRSQVRMTNLTGDQQVSFNDYVSGYKQNPQNYYIIRKGKVVTPPDKRIMRGNDGKFYRLRDNGPLPATTPTYINSYRQAWFNHPWLMSLGHAGAAGAIGLGIDAATNGNSKSKNKPDATEASEFPDGMRLD